MRDSKKITGFAKHDATKVRTLFFHSGCKFCNVLYRIAYGKPMNYIQRRPKYK